MRIVVETLLIAMTVVLVVCVVALFLVGAPGAGIVGLLWCVTMLALVGFVHAWRLGRERR